MATDTAPPAPGEPPDPPTSPVAGTASAPAADTGIMAALMAAVEPARPVTATGAGARPADDDPAAKADADGVVDRSSPGVTSAAYNAPEDLAGAGSDAAGARYKEGVIKTLIRAGATRWAKGGGTANKRLDLERARAGAHQVKEARTTTVMKSPGLPTRNGSGGVGGGGRNLGGNSGGSSGRNSTGNGSAGTGRGVNGGATGSGGRGPSGSDGSGGSGGGRGSSGSNGSSGSGGGRGTSGNGGGGSPKDTGSKGSADSGGKGKSGFSGNAGADGKAGKDGKSGASGSSGGSATGGSSGGSKGKGAKVDLEKGGGSGRGPSGPSGSSGGSGSGGGAGKNGKDGAAGHGSAGIDTRSPLQRSRETGHGDGSAVRNVVDHVKAYAMGAKDGYQDKKEENGKEHARLDRKHAQYKAQQQTPKKDDPQQQEETTVTGPSGQRLVIAPPDEGDDGVSTDVKPLLVKEIDTNTLTLGTQGARGSISRKELRNFKQYERKLEAKENHLIKVADACKSLEAAAEVEAKDCQELADQAKAVEGGEKLAAKLTKLADHAKAQATEAAELHKRAKRAAEMCKVVLTNIGTRYAPLYKAVVDSDETKPAELRFYNDKGSYAPAA
ncbi:hypothetical protein GCM10009753_66610 [Streptantibioticus ferralitis]